MIHWLCFLFYQWYNILFKLEDREYLISTFGSEVEISSCYMVKFSLNNIRRFRGKMVETRIDVLFPYFNVWAEYSVNIGVYNQISIFTNKLHGSSSGTDVLLKCYLEGGSPKILFNRNENTCWEKDLYQVFIVALSIIDKNWKQLTCQLHGEWIKKIKYMDKMEYYLSIKMS
jgi:hypothetical protein